MSTFCIKPLTITQLFTDVIAWLFAFFSGAKLWVGFSGVFFKEYSGNRINVTIANVTFGGSKLENEASYVIFLKDYQTRFAQALLQDRSRVKSS